MRGFARIRPGLGLLAALLLAIGASGSFAQEKVGVNSAVNPDATGTPPGGQPRRLIIGQEVVYNEHITTTDAGQTQLLFLDESSMTIGPNSDLTIDQFVYDPKSGTGKLAMSATRGLLRYVGGKLSKQDEAVTLRTSTATLAVRGGAFIAKIERSGAAQFVFIFGDGLRITGLNGVSQLIRRPGFQVSISGPGASPSPPAPEPPGQLAEFIQELDGRGGGSGGASVIPTEAVVNGSGIGQTISGNFQNSLQQAQNQNNYYYSNVSNQFQSNTGNNLSLTQTVGQGSNSTSQGIACVQGACNPNTITQVGHTQSGPIGGQNSISSNPVTPPPPTQPSTTFNYAGRLKNTNGNGTTNGFLDQSVNGNSTYTGALSFPVNTPQSGVFMATNVVNLGTLSFPLVPGVASFQGTSSVLGAITGTSFLSADDTYFYANITPVGQPTQRIFISGGTPVNSSFYQPTGATRIFAFSVQPDAALQSNIPFIRSQVGGNLPNASVSPLYVVAPATVPIGSASTLTAARGLQASLAINGQGANQQSAIAVTTGTIASLNGQPTFGGVMHGSSMLSASGTPVRLSAPVTSAVDGNGNSFYGNNAISGFTLNQTAYTNNGDGTLSTTTTQPNATETPLSGSANSYGFAQAAIPTSVPTGVGTNRTSSSGATAQSLTGNFGGLMYSTAQTNPYILTGSALISTDASTNRVQATLSGTPQSTASGVSSVTMQYGGLTGNDGGRSAFVDNNTFAALESPTNAQQINGQNLVVNGSTAAAGQLYLASSGAAPPPTSLLPTGASYCNCQYLQWGYWGGDLDSGNSSNSAISSINRGNINFWVAGSPTSLADLNSLQSQMATATYSGHAIGSVFNNGASYVAAGGFNGTYAFGTQTGSFTISNFDGHTITAAGSAPLSGNSYSFGLNSAGVKGAINGQFYGPAAANTGGNFAFQTTVGPTYLASGIFAGVKQ